MPRKKTTKPEAKPAQKAPKPVPGGRAMRIDPEDPPPLGSVFTFEVEKGQMDPRTQAEAKKKQEFKLKLVAILDHVKDLRFIPLGPGATVPSEGFAISLEHYNEIYAPAVTEIRFPVAKQKAPRPMRTKAGGIPEGLWDELVAASVEQAKCQKAYSEAHMEAKACRDALDAATDRIIEILKEARTGQPRLPFGEKADDWRDAKFSDRTKFPKLRPGIVEALRNAKIDTIGQLVDRQSDARFNLSDVKGVGEKAQTAIEDACMRFHERRKAEADKAAKKGQAAG